MGSRSPLGGDYYSVDDDTALSWGLDEDFVAPGGFRPADSMTAYGEVPSRTSIDMWGASLTGEFDLGFATLTSISSVRDTENHSHFDVDATPLPLLKIDYVSGTRAYQQEVRLASSDTDPLSWQIGAFYLHSKQFNQSHILGLAASNNLSPEAGLFIDAQLVTDSYAGFGEVTYAITPSTRITGGIRWTKDERKLDGTRDFVLNRVPISALPTPPGRLSYDEFTYRIALRQDLADDINVRVIQSGFQGGHLFAAVAREGGGPADVHRCLRNWLQVRTVRPQAAIERGCIPL